MPNSQLWRNYCCRSPLPALAREGIRLFNRGQYFECHEALEDAWRQTASPCRLLYQAILQLGVSLYHVQRCNLPGAQKVLRRAQRKLDLLPDNCQQVDVRALRLYARELANLLADDGVCTPPPIVIMLTLQ